MSNIFDHLSDSTFDVVTATMGFDALWNGITARVLFNEPARDESISDHEYQFARCTMEYKAKAFPGLKEACDDKQIVKVSIEGKNYYVKEVLGQRNSARDGYAYTAFLEEE